MDIASAAKVHRTMSSQPSSSSPATRDATEAGTVELETLLRRGREATVDELRACLAAHPLPRDCAPPAQDVDCGGAAIGAVGDSASRWAAIERRQVMLLGTAIQAGAPASVVAMLIDALPVSACTALDRHGRTPLSLPSSEVQTQMLCEPLRSPSLLPHTWHAGSINSRRSILALYWRRLWKR